MAAPTLKQLWKRAPTAPSAGGGGGDGGAVPPLVDGVDANAAKEPSQLVVVEGDSLRKPAPAAADASCTAMVVDDTVRERSRDEAEREREGGERGRSMEDPATVFRKSIPSKTRLQTHP